MAQVPGTCWHSGFVTAAGKVLKATPDHSELVQRCGSPVAALQELLYGDPDLPDGAVPHLLGLPKGVKGSVRPPIERVQRCVPSRVAQVCPTRQGTRGCA